MTNTVAAPTFHCIYCGHSGPGTGFDNEHVFPRSLCGSGTNWTLINRVCKKCNNHFSRFENELLHNAAETIARGFSGPLGRSARDAEGLRIQPLKVSELFALNVNDTLVYEGGFSFPSDFYFRPQMIDVGDGTLLHIIANQSEFQAFQDALLRFDNESKRITLPRPKNRKEYEIVTYEKVNDHWRPANHELSKNPSDVFFREIIQRPTLQPITPRLAQNDDGKLFVHAAGLDALGQFIDLIYDHKPPAPRPPLPPEPGNQTFFSASKSTSSKFTRRC